MNKNTILILIIVGFIFVSGCGPSPEELAATAVAETAAAATNTPLPPTATLRPTNTPTPTLVPYDLSALITGVDDKSVYGASVSLAELDSSSGRQFSDETGQVFWSDLPGETINITAKAQGYFPYSASHTIDRGVNQLMIVLERDPHGLLPEEVCGEGQEVLYIEDFQDGEAQGWSSQISGKAMGWDIIPHPDSQGNLVLVNTGALQSGVEFIDGDFGNAVWHLQFMKDGNQINAFEWRSKYDYTDETGHVDHSAYWAAFENQPDVLAIHRQKGPEEVPLFSQDFFIKKNEWQQVDMSTFEGRFGFWLNDRVLVSYKDPGPLPSGTINISIYGVTDPEQTTYYDNFVICELAEDYQPTLSE